MVPIDEPGQSRVRGVAVRGGVGLLGGVCLLLGLSAWPAAAANPDEAETLFRTGHYDECARMAGAEVDAGSRLERWHLLKIRAELAKGDDPAALASLENAIRRVSGSVPLYLLGHDVYRRAGRDHDASTALDAVDGLIRMAPRRFASPEGRVALGRFFVLRGADAKKVLSQFYDVAIKQKPDHVDAYLATAELALAKQDNALAATTLAKAPREAAQDPHFHYLTALAFKDDDRKKAAASLDAALKINPRHVDSLLERVEKRIDDERYVEAEDILKQIAEINPREPRAWAYRAVLAHLRNDPSGESTARGSALATWKTNPEVDHLIGRELSKKYRFAEGSAYQRKSLELDPGSLPAKVQLCQDLLRLGDEDEGWKLAAEVFAADAYNVVAYNLITLRDRLAGFRTLTGDGFVVRMDPREANLYGSRVLALLTRARKTLCEKYGVTITEPVVVEIFPQKKEFAVRTFGLPGAEGFLGVCFGRVITANSPASQGEHPSNWEAVLWHEFCHAVTLGKTRNKMPRWLSEGISVYEEETQDRAWGSSLSPRYREMILGDDLTPLSRLSSAFLAPKSPFHIQFAYFESALAVEYLIGKAGLPALKGLLDDLGAGIPINEALPRRAGMTLVQLDEDFAKFARGKAQAVAPGFTWDEPELPPEADSKAISDWLEKHPRSFPGLRRLAARLVKEEKWQPAKDALEKLRAADPDYIGEDNAYVLLAAVHKRTADPAAERAALEELASRDGSASPAYLRLMELEESSKDWRGMARDARRLLAVNPLIPAPFRRLAGASEQIGDDGEAIASYRSLAILDDADPAEVHYRLARLLGRAHRPDEARREALKALEEAPRFLDAHRLLLELVGPEKLSDTPPPPPRPEGRSR